MKRIAAGRHDRLLFKRRLISVAVMSAMSSHAGANPTGAQVVNGQVNVATQGSVVTVTNTPNAIVNWQSFSIGGNETTRFVQQSAASAVLNRVVGVDPSVILGTLQSNGKVLLINTNGIVFGQGARVDVAGLVASTLNLNDQDFLAGRLNFQSSPLGSGSVVNRGTIATPEGGSVFLVGAAVENSGIIHAPGGEVILAAGQTVRLGSTGAPNVLVEIEAPANQAVNLGEIAVGAGKAGIYGGFVEQKGIVSANTATVNAAGKIVFKATRDATVAAGSSTTASGGQGGTVAVESGGTTRVDGVVSATGASGKGGTIHLLGNQVGVAGGASVDASGAAGGGTILVGGDYKGGNPDVRNARATFVGGNTQLRADATGSGDGGRIIVWSDEVTRAYGSISARGGPLGGDGGFVETSSAGYLEVTRGPDLMAPLATGGSWLIDPYNIIVSNVSSQLTSNSGAPNFTPTGDTSTIGADLIGAQLSTGASVMLDTNGAGSQVGSIVVQGSLLKTAGGAANLTLKAHNNIYLQPGSRIESSAGALAVTLNADQDANGTGGVSLNGTSIITNGGNLVIGGGANPLIGFAIAAADATFGDLSSGVSVFNSSIATGVGDVSIRGRTNVASGQFGDAVNLNDAAVIQTTSGNVSIYGDASARFGNVSFAAGVRLDFTARISSQTGTVLLNGVGAGTPGLPAASGTSGVVVQKDALLEVTGAGRIELVGNGGASSSATDSVEGVTLLDRARLLADGGGTIAITGSPGTPAPGGHVQNGVALNSAGSTPGVTVRAGGASGSITITGLPANGTVVENANGVVLQQAGTLVEATGDATITINGTGSDTSIAGGWAGANGLLMFGGARVRSAAGAITITGTGGLTSSTGSGVQGVTLFDAGTAITTVDGAIQITGTGGGTLANPSGQSAHGIALQSGAKIEATGTGTVALTGTSGVVAGVFNPNFGRFTTAGAIAAYSDGVDVGSGARVVTSSGALTIVGIGSAVLNDALGTQGVLIANAGSSVQSSSGNVSITGTGGGTPAGRSGGDTLGVLVWDNASVSTGGAGTVRIEGTGGATSGGISIGVSVYAGSSVTANDGDITLIGVGGQSTNQYTGRDSFANHGVEVGSDTGSGLSSRIRTTGNGSILLQGVAGNAAGGANDAVTLRENTVVTTAGTGSVTLLGTLSSAAVNDTASTFAGDGWNGGVLITAGSSVRSGVNLTSGGGAITITGLGPVDGTGAASTPQLVAVRIDSGALVESVAGGAISISGDLRDSRTTGLQGVHIAGSSNVRGHAGNVSITGIGGGANRADADGVLISGDATVETSSGLITVTGSLVDFANPNGQYLQGVTVAHATVKTTAGGAIALDGTGAGTAANRIRGNSSGMAIVDGANVTTLAGGDITLVGTGGFATNGFISGVYISSDVVFQGNSPTATAGAPVTVSATGTGKVTITGYLGSPGALNGTDSAGVAIEGFGIPASGSGANRPIGATVTTEDGALTIAGYGSGFVRGATPTVDETLAGAGDVQGVYIADDARIGSKGNGFVVIHGEAGVVRGYLKDSFANPGTPVLGVDASGVTIERSAMVFSTTGTLDMRAQGGYSNNANAQLLGFPAGTIATESVGGLIAGGNAEFPTTISSVSGDIRIDVTGPGTAAQPIGSAAAAAFGFGNISVSTGSSSTIAISGDGGATNNGHSSAVWIRDAVVNFDAGIVSLLGNTNSPILSSNTGANPELAAGVEIANSSISTTATLNITGVGGNATNGQNYGVWIHGGSSVSGLNASAGMSIVGTGGGSGSVNNRSDGINIGEASAIASAGLITLQGTGAGTGQARAGGGIAGVRIAGGASITSNGASSITVTGIGGVQTGSGSAGVSIEGAGSAILAPNGGNITIVGNAGDSDLATATTAGSLVGTNPGLATWDLTGLEWSGSGVQVVNGASMSTSTGDISVTGTGGLAGAGATAGKGFWGAGIEVRGGTAVSTVSGAIHLTGTAPGDVTRPMGRNTWGVHIEEAAAITSTGATGGSISITGIGTFASGMFDSAGALGAPAVVADASGVELHAGGVVSTVGGDITIDGTTARVPANTFGRFGVAIGEATDAGAFSGVASQSGKITITGGVPTAQAGFGGATGLSDGVLLYQGGCVQTASGAIAITGHAGEGTGGGMVGVELFDDATVPEARHSQVLSTSGTVSIVGTGGASSGAGARNVGVAIGQGSFVATTGTGSVDIRGTGGAGTDGENHGVWIHDGSAVVTVGNNAGIAISGTGGTGSASDGIHIDGASTEVAGAAVTLLGTRGTGGSSFGLHQLAGAITAEALTVSADGGVSMTGANVLNALTAINATAGNLDICVQTRKLAPIGDVILNDIVNSGPGDVNLTLGQVGGVAYGMSSGHVYSSGGAFNVDRVEMFGVTINSAGAHFTALSISGGDNVFNTGATSIGALTLDSASTPQSPVTLGGASALTIAGEFAWYDGLVANTGGLTTGGSTSILRLLPDGITPHNAVLDTNWHTLPGSITQYDGSSSGNFIIQAGHTITNAGQFLVDPVGTFTGSIQGAGATFVNQGWLSKDTPVGTQMDTHVVNDGGTLASNGVGVAFQITDLTLQGAGTIQGAAPITIPGVFAWTGGKIAAGTSVSADGTGSISAGVAKTLDGTLVSNGAFALQDNLAGTGLLRNAAQMDVGSFTVQPAVANDGQLNILAGIFGGAGTNAFVNAGSFTKSGAGTGLISAAFSNRGTVNVDAGTLAVTSFPSNSGTIDIAAGATFSTSGQALVNSPAGKIGGTGTLSVGGATLTNAGILSPGASPGTLHIHGNLTLTSSSVLAMEVEGTAPGQFDVVDVSGKAALAGTLRVTLPGVYRGAVGDTFSIINAANVSGAFATVNTPPDMTLTAAYAGSAVTLSIDALINRWSGSSGLWTLGNNWALGRAPSARDDVVIDVGAAQTVVVPAGTALDAGSVTVSSGTVELQGAVTIASGTQLRLLGGTVNSAGSLANAGAVTVAAGTLQAASLVNSGTLAINGGSLVTTGTFANLGAGTTTLQSGLLSVGAVTNSGTLNLNGGTLTRATGSTFGNSGRVSLINQTLNLGGGDGGVGGGSYDVGLGAALLLNQGTYTISALGTGTGGSLTINGATVSAGPLTNAGTATLQSGSLSVGAVANSGTLNLNGATLTRSSGASFGNSGTVNLNTGTLSLDGGDGGLAGGRYNLQSATNLEFTGGNYGIGSIAGAGAVTIEGASSDAKLYASNTMNIAVQTLTVRAGSHSATIDPPDLTLDVPGGVSLTGGSANGAYALIQGGNVSITTSTITLTGGAGNGSYAGIDAMSGSAKIVVSDQITMVPGGGSSSGAWMSAAGPLTVSALGCNGCTLLSDNPSQSATSEAGLFGNPVSLSLNSGLLQVPSSVIVGVQTAQTGGEGDAVLSKQEEEEKENEQSSDEARAKEEHKNEKPRQVCM